MNITESLTQMLEKEGVVLENRQDVYNSIDEAIVDGRFSFIISNGTNIGFFTWNKNGDEVFVNNMIVFKKYRGSFNLLQLRGFLKEKCGSVGAFSWRSRKKREDKLFIQKRINPC